MSITYSYLTNNTYGLHSSLPNDTSSLSEGILFPSWARKSLVNGEKERNIEVVIKRLERTRGLPTFEWASTLESAESFVSSLLEAISYNGSHTLTSFRILVKAFFPFNPFGASVENAAATNTVFSSLSYEYSHIEAISRLVHKTIHRILFMVPLSVPSLFNVIAELYPTKFEILPMQHWYLLNCLRVTRYCPSLTPQIISLVISKIVQIDVEIRLEDLPEDEEDELQFEIDQNTSLSTLESLQSREMAEKLDDMMLLMFRYVDDSLGVSSVLWDGLSLKSSSSSHPHLCEPFVVESDPSMKHSPLAPQDFFHTLLSSFDASILHTHKSKYTQFLLFYVCRLQFWKRVPSLKGIKPSILNVFPQNKTRRSRSQDGSLSKSPSDSALYTNTFQSTTSPHTYDTINSLKIDYGSSFLGYLLNKFLSPSAHTFVRQVSVAYIGSFLARAKFLSTEVVCDAMIVLMDWALNYLDQIEGSRTSVLLPDISVHGLFFSVCQSLYYIFCFQEKWLLDENQEGRLNALHDSKGDTLREFFEDIGNGFLRITESKLNPFLVCLPAVVKEFCRIATKSKLYPCTHILIRNRNIAIPTKSFNSQENKLDSFFPFDPYLLKQSSKCIDEIYNHWSDTVEDEESDTESPDDEETDSEVGGSGSNGNDSLTSDPPDENTLDQLTEDFMSMTPETSYISYHR